MTRQLPPMCPIPQDFRYYMLRDNDVMVPMIPADQIAFGVPGVPRQLTHQQMSSEGWKYLSQPASAPMVPAARATVMRTPSPATAWTQPIFRSPDHQVRNDQYVATEHGARPIRWSHSPTISADHSPAQRTAPVSGTPEKAISLTDRFAEIYPVEARRYGYQLPNPSGIEPDFGKKEFCTHWIRTGECDFTAVGCKFKHEMPDLPKLKELGFIQGLPRWWKEKLVTVARGPTWIEQRRAAQANGEEMETEVTPRREVDPLIFERRVAVERDAPRDDIRQKRAILRREAGNERPTLPTISNAAQSTNCPVIPVQNLIDLDDTPAPPSSPQLSTTSSVSVSSIQTAASYDTTVSGPASPLLEVFLIPEKNRPICKGPKAKQKVKLQHQGPNHRRGSDNSSLSTMSETNERPAPATTKPSKSNREQMRTIPKASQQVAEPSKPTLGLGNSRYAGRCSPSRHNEQSKAVRDIPVMQLDKQQQQARQRDEAGSPTKSRNKSSKKQNRAKRFSAPLAEHVQGATMKSGGALGKRP
ncbi:hypothetical protein NX059_008087 [Plenodomus lindquistii]|nr:hypothetical protein NX059_008087 [Plenodomus lindquistii]